MKLREGTYLQNRYEILDRIGTGGMSDVYKAQDHKLNRLVAVKVLKEEFCHDEGFVGKFKMEAQAAAGLQHQNVVNVYDVVDENRLHYIVMELVEGVTLKNFIAAKGFLDVKEALVISIQVAQGIGAAHDQHIVHRDIKPQNMIISSDGKVKVADFGIAKAVSSDTLTSTAMGSVHYISPEQAKGDAADERSDIYSLGITMFEMVTGRVPFENENSVSIAISHIEQDVPLPSAFNPLVSHAYDEIVMKCTQKKPERRYQKVQELIVDLRKALINPNADLNHVKIADAETDPYATRPITPQQIGEINTAVKIKNHQRKKDRYLSNEYIEDEEDTRTDKLVAAAGIIVAIAVVAAVVFGVIRFSKIFTSGVNELETLIETREGILDTQIKAPDIKGKSYDIAREQLKDSSLDIEVIGYVDSDLPKENVVSQSPEAGETVDKYSKIGVVLSNGKNQETESASEEEPETEKEESTTTMVPSIVGLTEDEAIAELAEAELVPGAATPMESDTVPAGVIISQTIVSNTEIAKGAQIPYTVSTGPAEADGIYYGAIDETYSVRNLIGPGSEDSTFVISVKLHQEGYEDKYIIEPREVTGSVVLPVKNNRIEGAYGVEDGEIQVIDERTGDILKSWTISFFPGN